MEDPFDPSTTVVRLLLKLRGMFSRAAPEETPRPIKALRAFIARIAGRRESLRSNLQSVDPIGSETTMTLDPGARATAGNADGRVLLQVDRGRVWALNGTASLIWDGLADGNSVGQIAARLTAEFEIPLAQAESDVQAFVSALRARGLARQARAGEGNAV